MSNTGHEECDKECAKHATLAAEHYLQEKRITALEEIVKEIPKMQARVHMLMYILIGTMTILIAISTFSFLQLLDFKNMYFQDRKEHAQMHSTEKLEQEQRYIDLINKIGNRVGILESKSSYDIKNTKTN